MIECWNNFFDAPAASLPGLRCIQEQAARWRGADAFAWVGVNTIAISGRALRMAPPVRKEALLDASFTTLFFEKACTARAA